MSSPIVKLQVERMSQTMAEGGFTSVIESLRDPEQLKRHAKDAEKFVVDAIAAVRSAPDADPKWTDDEIAQQILDGIEAKKRERLLKSR